MPPVAPAPTSHVSLLTAPPTAGRTAPLSPLDVLSSASSNRCKTTPPTWSRPWGDSPTAELPTQEIPRQEAGAPCVVLQKAVLRESPSDVHMSGSRHHRQLGFLAWMPVSAAPLSTRNMSHVDSLTQSPAADAEAGGSRGQSRRLGVGCPTCLQQDQVDSPLLHSLLQVPPRGALGLQSQQTCRPSFRRHTEPWECRTGRF